MDKPRVYAEIPPFDQYTQAVIQDEEVDMGDHIFVGVTVIDLDGAENENGFLI